MLERRKRQRWPAYWAGRISFKRSRAAAECLIRNTSANGAKLVLGGEIFVPREFELNIPKQRADYRAKVIWRRSEEVGISLERIGANVGPRSADEVTQPRISKQPSPSFPTYDALTPMALLRRLKKLRQQNALLRRRLLMQTD